MSDIQKNIHHKEVQPISEFQFAPILMMKMLLTQFVAMPMEIQR
jgi:hypothetical protein